MASRLGPVQAQDYYGAKWSLGLRSRAATDKSVEQAFNDGEILRTHVMRPTWHFVAPRDIRWILKLTAPRVNAANAHMYSRLGLDQDLFSRSNRVIRKVLDGKHFLTRGQLSSALDQAGIKATGVSLAYLLMRAELDAIICSGPRRGSQFTYALLEERCPPSDDLTEKEALEELVRRYFAGHGPATIRDFVWWSGLTMSQAKIGIGDGSGLKHEIVDGTAYWSSADEAALEGQSLAEGKMARGPPEGVFLLPMFDEFLVGYSSFGKTRLGAPQRPELLLFNCPIVARGAVVGSWRREFRRTEVVIQAAPFEEFSTRDTVALSAAAERYGQFVGMAATCLIKGFE